MVVTPFTSAELKHLYELLAEEGWAISASEAGRLFQTEQLPHLVTAIINNNTQRRFLEGRVENLQAQWDEAEETYQSRTAYAELAWTRSEEEAEAYFYFIELIEELEALVLELPGLYEQIEDLEDRIEIFQRVLDDPESSYFERLYAQQQIDAIYELVLELWDDIKEAEEAAEMLPSRRAQRDKAYEDMLWWTSEYNTAKAEAADALIDMEDIRPQLEDAKLELAEIPNFVDVHGQRYYRSGFGP